MGQGALFGRSEIASMRDRTRSRKYSPAAEEFRREHERHRAWGLQRRHAEKLRRLRRDEFPPAAGRSRGSGSGAGDVTRRVVPVCEAPSVMSADRASRRNASSAPRPEPAPDTAAPTAVASASWVDGSPASPRRQPRAVVACAPSGAPSSGVRAPRSAPCGVWGWLPRGGGRGFTRCCGGGPCGRWSPVGGRCQIGYSLFVSAFLFLPFWSLPEWAPFNT
jgi:hypothetical protein